MLGCDMTVRVPDKITIPDAGGENIQVTMILLNLKLNAVLVLENSFATQGH